MRRGGDMHDSRRRGRADPALQVAATPAGVVHGFGNPHSVTARALLINTPDIRAQYFDVGAIVGASEPHDPIKMDGDDATLRSRPDGTSGGG